jgi:hypothetical protein
MLSNSLNFYLPKNNRCYENYVYLSNISIRSFVLLAYPLLFLKLCIFCVKSQFSAGEFRPPCTGTSSRAPKLLHPLFYTPNYGSVEFVYHNDDSYRYIYISIIFIYIFILIQPNTMVQRLPVVTTLFKLI